MERYRDNALIEVNILLDLRRADPEDEWGNDGWICCFMGDDFFVEKKGGHAL